MYPCLNSEQKSTQSPRNLDYWMASYPLNHCESGPEQQLLWLLGAGRLALSKFSPSGGAVDIFSEFKISLTVLWSRTKEITCIRERQRGHSNTSISKIFDISSAKFGLKIFLPVPDGSMGFRTSSLLTWALGPRKP